MDLIWRENIQFLRSRLVFDADFLKFLEELYEIGKDKHLADVLTRLQEGRRREKEPAEKDQAKAEEGQAAEIEALPIPGIKAETYVGVQQQQDMGMVQFWSNDDKRDEQGLIDQLDGEQGQDRQMM